MIRIVVNGTPQRFDAPLPVSGLIEKMALAGKKIAVEKNGEIVPRGLHRETLIENGDRLEIVVAVGGG